MSDKKSETLSEKPNPETVNLYFDGDEFPCTVNVDRNGEFVFETVEKNADGESVRFVKFPANADLVTEVAKHNDENSVPVIIVEENDAIVSQEAQTAIDKLFAANK